MEMKVEVCMYDRTLSQQAHSAKTNNATESHHAKANNCCCNTLRITNTATQSIRLVLCNKDSPNTRQQVKWFTPTTSELNNKDTSSPCNKTYLAQ